MKHLDNDELLAAIATCAALGPSGAEIAIEKVVTGIKASSLSVTNVDPPALFVRRILEQFRSVIVPEHYESLTKLDIYVPPLPLCNAVASATGKHIIIFEGLLQAVRFRLEISHLINAVLKLRATQKDDRSISDEEFKTLSYQTMLLSIHFHRSHNQLPTVFDILESSLQEDAFMGFAGVLVFILLHELGHLKLHPPPLTKESNKAYLPILACPEKLNRLKIEEFEADQFAMEAFIPEARSVALINAVMALQFFADFEQHSGIFTSSHPMVINRLTHLNQLPDVFSDEVIKLNVLKILQNHRLLTTIQIDGKHPNEDQLPRDKIRSFAKESLYRLIDDEPTCRAALEKLRSIYQDSCRRGTGS